jgi:hypothetical protein
LSDLEVLAIVVALLVYGLLGGSILNYWQRRRNRELVSRHIDPMARLWYWLPTLIFVEVWCLIGAAAVGAFLTYTLMAHGTFDIYRLLGVVLGLAFIVVIFTVWDLSTILYARRLAVRQKMA